jgi:SNF2 family DNA or RNA helicase
VIRVVVANDISIYIEDCSSALFLAIKVALKNAKCRWNDKTKAWHTSVWNFDKLRSYLEEMDIVKIENEPGLLALRSGKEELVIRGRVVPDYSLLLYPPMKGKPPYEDYQKIDIAAGLSRNRYAYFLGMGSGKTYVLSALIAHYMLKWGSVKRAFVVTSNIGVRNIYHELRKFIKDLDPSRITIASAECRDPFYESTDIILCSYNTFRLICNHYKKKLKIEATTPRKPFLPLEKWSQGEPMMLALDESHNIATHNSQQGHLMALHSSFFAYRYLFTGTPADKPEKLYNQLKTLDSTLTHQLSYTDWLEEYAELGTRYSQYDVREWKHHKLAELNKKITSKYGVYRDSADIIDLPPHYEKRIYVDMSQKHRAIYEAFVTTTLQEAQNEGHSSTRDLVNKFPYMMLACENPYLLEKHLDRFDDKLASKILGFSGDYMSKLGVLDDVLADHEKEKGLVWIAHPRTAEILAERYKKLNPIVITGSTPQEERNQLIETFKKEGKHQILIANIQVLNTSVTITECTWQFYLERNFNYTIVSQSAARIYRIGQTKPVHTYIPIYSKSLDTLMDRNLTTKDALVKGLVSKAFLTQEEWINIFNFSEDTEAPT